PPKYTTSAMDGASKTGRVVVLTWWKNSGHEMNGRRNGADMSLNKTSNNGHVDVLEWWRKSGLKMRWTYVAVKSARAKRRFEVLEWW
ncbi:hypothetical protein BJ742DRAFT_666015, partial [Cladochytrium replicatum]